MSEGTGYLELEDGTVYPGTLFGSGSASSGEVVFNTGMVGYPESLTDPSYRGQILAMTYPLIGNYGIPHPQSRSFESGSIHVRGLVVSEIVHEYSHHDASCSLSDWLASQDVAGISGIDTRALTKRLRERGTMLGRIVPDGDNGPFLVEDPNRTDLVSEVSGRETVRFGEDNVGPLVTLVDCGCKRGILDSLLERGCRVDLVPYDIEPEEVKGDGVLISNGPGDPSLLKDTIRTVSALIEGDRPVAGICLGCQLIALAAGARTYKLRFGHRSQNQPCRETGTGRCVITSQNHGYAVDGRSLPEGWSVWSTNLNDGTVEGIRHSKKPFFALQYHPEARPGPKDSLDFFDRFLEAMHDGQ